MNQRRKFTSSLMVAAGALLLCASAGVHAQTDDFPNKPITLMIPYPPGGSADMLARPVAAKMQKDLGQPVVLEYKPGAGGTIASAQLARSKPDGYTVLMVLAAHAINPSMYSSLTYDTEKDFAPVTMLATLPMLVAAPLATPADNIQELIAYAKKNPDELTFASAGNGNTSHLAAELFKTATDTKMVHVPYKGSGPAVVALLGGEVSLMFDSISTSAPQVKAGKLKGLAVTGKTRSSILPDVPTVAESGLPDFEVNGWYGIIAPAGTPDAAVNKLYEAFTAAAKDPEIREQLNGFGYEVVGTSPAEFSTHISREIEKWRGAVEQSGAKVQ